ncbi:hypothetical protein J5Y03_08345 [Bacillus sp. RG28]|uniref:Uncharacterized protein n=1 Tax=Gottfriedia endophytica TaxID=2820819 RepID=A0A940NJD0_9BACI|nr:hypothetical protein [Gottfriedia endophytica]MBP0725202.1 hypothetical protein [Gottfriedia endophytica]
MERKKVGTPYFNELELNNILKVNSNKKVFIPNQFFKDLIECNEFKPKISKIKTHEGTVNTYEKEANANHIAFAFCFVYMISYLYRYANYIYYKGEEECFIDDKLIYMLCGTSPTSRGKDGVSYITKKDGLLERLGYSVKEDDFPIDYVYYVDVFGNVDYSFPDFILYSKVKYDLPTGYNKYNKKINYPIRAMHYDKESESANTLDGYFYDVQYSTEIKINVFTYCMARKELGKLGFYLYAYLKSRCDYFYATTDRKGYVRTLQDLSEDTGIGKSVLSKLLTVLEEHNMIFNSHNHYVIGLPKGKKVPPNTYITFDFEDFYKYEKKSVETRKVVSYEYYDSKVGVYLGTIEEVNEVNIELKMPLNL